MNTDTLLEKYKTLFTETTTHPLVQEWCKGTLPDEKISLYLSQDLQFFETSLRLLCKLTLLAPTSKSLIRLAQQLGFLANDENTYFHDCLELVKPEFSTLPPIKLPLVEHYIAFLQKLIDDPRPSYEELITSMWCAEIVYFQWAHNLPRAESLHWKYQKWIDLHDGDDFAEWCSFLGNEVNKLELSPNIDATFAKALQLEFDFFQSCYTAENE